MNDLKIDTKKSPSIEEYIAAYSIERILQDARFVLESDNELCRKFLAGVILVTLDHIKITQSLEDLKSLKQNLST